MCLYAGRGAKDVGMRNSMVVSPLSETRGVGEVSVAGDGVALLRHWPSRWQPYVARGIETGAR